MTLTTPTDHAGAYEWAAVYLAHMALGVALVAVIAAALSLVMWRQGAWAAVIVSVAYGALWEGAVQRLGAGLLDAAVDWSAVTLGAAVGYVAWSLPTPPIMPARIAGPVGRLAPPDHFAGRVAAIRQGAADHRATVVVHVQHVDGDVGGNSLIKNTASRPR